MNHVIDHNSYNRISDKVFILNSDWMVKFTVELNRAVKEEKRNYHSEYGYMSKLGFGISINRDFNYYLSIESFSKDSNNLRMQVRIYQEDIFFLQFKLSNVVKWFTGDESVFAKNKDGKLIIRKRCEESVTLSYENSISFEPAFIYNPDTDVQIIGVKMYINNSSNGTFIDVNRLLSFHYFISNFNMYLAAQGLLSYIGAPDYGTNFTNMADGTVSVDNSSNSFFSKVGAKKSQ